jgi:TonB family protein
MNFGFGYFASRLAASSFLCWMALTLWAVQTPQAKPSDEEQPASHVNFVPASDYELKIVQGEFWVRQKSTSDWKQSSKVSEPIVIGALDGGHKVYLATKAIKPPRAIHMVDPPYPDGERKSGKEGLVSLHVIVNDHGVIQLSAVDASPGPAFAAAAVEAAKKWTFKPAKLDDTAVAVLISVTMEFRLY